ncbi:MAG TPA: energy transducer TonB [Candidatus Angelobacter sp.]|jgi:protein TonB|nr:energy transducer TonB [Candidatus Angelobacter sp.]
MFGDTLLESSSTPHKGKRWPMATAFTAEAIIGGLLVLVPLLSTGVIPVSARVPIYIPIKPVTLEPMEPVRTADTFASGPVRGMPEPTAVVLVSNNPDAIHYGRAVETTIDPAEVRSSESGIGMSTNLSDLVSDGRAKPNVKFAGPKRITSRLTEAQLVNRVEPVYPHIAVVSNIQGQVKLHAIIARDGSIQSLNPISGHPLLVRAAMEAVQQWRYRPYILNGETVEVETLITVNFKKDLH